MTQPIFINDEAADTALFNAEIATGKGSIIPASIQELQKVNVYQQIQQRLS